MHFKYRFRTIRRKFTESRAATFRRADGANSHLMLGSRETGYPMPFLSEGKPLKRGAVSVKVFGNLTPNDTKHSEKEVAYFR
jgi:hypothetical protein